MKKNDLTISIITICRNAVDQIERTLFSVAEQTYPFIDYVVIDGASTDGTAERIAAYQSHVSTLIQEPDKGIYDAMNKGIRCAGGDYCLFLNAGDFLCHSSAIENAVKWIQSADNVDVFYGNQLLYNEFSGSSHIWRPKKRSHLDFYSGSLPHASSFIRKSAFNEIGYYNTLFQIAGDYEWFLRAVMHHLQFCHIDTLVSVFVEGRGISTRSSIKELQTSEKLRARDLHFKGYRRRIYKIGLFLRKNKLL